MKNDDRIEHITIPIGLKDILNNAGFTIESILNNDPSKIAQDLGIDEYIGQIIQRKREEHSKMVNLFNIIF